MEKIKGFVVFLDEREESAYIIEIKPDMVEIKTQVPRKSAITGFGSKFVDASSPTYILIVNPDFSGKRRTYLAVNELVRHQKNIGTEENPIMKYTETKADYKKRERKQLMRIIKR